MEAAASLDDFAADPIGRYLVGAGWVHWCAAADLFGVILFGRPGRDAAARLTRALAVELAAPVTPHQSIVDARRVDGVDAEGFEVLSAYVTDHHAELAAQVTRLALVRPEGLPGAAIAGFFEVLAPPYPVQVFDDAGAALAWLGRAEIAPALAALAAVASAPPLVAQLHAHLAACLVDATLAGAAAHLHLSPRSLQRRLRAAGTTFQSELTAARVRAAQTLMLDSDAPLTRIALDVGFTSPQHFSNQFRRLVGQSPSAWRAQHR